MTADFHHLIVYVPVEHADRIRSVLAERGAGKIGPYDSCSFSVRGTGRFRPLEGSNPAIGESGRIECVDEERIEVLVPRDPAILTPLLRALKEAHPYEEPAVHLLPMTDYHSVL